jgi:exopolysaccharide biosynthesis protein
VEPLGDSNFFVGRRPRTAFGTFADGRVGWVVVDGRSTRARGATLPALADLLVEMGMVDAVNLDGGGSSTLYIEGCSVNGVVNFPSDGGGDDHGGTRAVADGVFGWFGRR